jgi:hypothetical protein
MKKKFNHNLFNMNSQIKLTLTENSIGMRDPRDNIQCDIGIRAH